MKEIKLHSCGEEFMYSRIDMVVVEGLRLNLITFQDGMNSEYHVVCLLSSCEFLCWIKEWIFLVDCSIDLVSICWVAVPFYNTVLLICFAEKSVFINCTRI